MDLPSWARVGAKVVCVDVAKSNRSGRPELALGSTYEIRWLGVYAHPNGSTFVGCRLVGIERLEPLTGEDCPFRLARFRPLVDQQTDIATHFAHHLKQPERV